MLLVYVCKKENHKLLVEHNMLGLEEAVYRGGQEEHDWEEQARSGYLNPLH